MCDVVVKGLFFENHRKITIVLNRNCEACDWTFMFKKTRALLYKILEHRDNNRHVFDIIENCIYYI